MALLQKISRLLNGQCLKHGDYLQPALEPGLGMYDSTLYYFCVKCEKEKNGKTT